MKGLEDRLASQSNDSSEYDDLKEELEEVKSERDMFAEENDSLSEANVSLEEKVEMLESNLEQGQKEHDKLMEATLQHKKRVGEKEEEIKDLRDRISQLSTENTQLKNAGENTLPAEAGSSKFDELKYLVMTVLIPSIDFERMKVASDDEVNETLLDLYELLGIL